MNFALTVLSITVLSISATPVGQGLAAPVKASEFGGNEIETEHGEGDWRKLAEASKAPAARRQLPAPGPRPDASGANLRPRPNPILALWPAALYTAPTPCPLLPLTPTKVGSKVDPAPPATPPSTETVKLTLTRTCNSAFLSKCNTCNHLCLQVSPGVTGGPWFPEEGTCMGWNPKVVSDQNDTTWNSTKNQYEDYDSVRATCTEQLQQNVAAATGIYTKLNDAGYTRADCPGCKTNPAIVFPNLTNWTYAHDELDSLISIEQLVSEYRLSDSYGLIGQPLNFTSGLQQACTDRTVPGACDIMSEIFTFTIAVPNFTTAVAVHASLSTSLGTAAAASKFLLGPDRFNLEIYTDPTITIVGPPSAPPPPPSPPSPPSSPPPRDDGDDGLSTGAGAARGTSNLV